MSIKYLDIGSDAMKLTRKEDIAKLEQQGIQVTESKDLAKDEAVFYDDKDDEVLAVVVSLHDNRVTWQLAPETK